MSLAVRGTELVPIATLRPFPGNARVHDDDLLRESIRLHGQYKALVVQRDTNFVLAGNGTYFAMMAEEFPEALVHWIECDEVEATRINLIDNRAQERGGYDDGLLAALLRTLEDPTFGTGWDDDALQELFARVEPHHPGLADPDDVPHVPDNPISNRGDVWLLGDEHRVMCGDSTDPADMAILMAEDRAQLVFTDPPYGVVYDGGHGARTRGIARQAIENDELEGDALRLFLQRGLQPAFDYSRDGAAWYVCGPSGPQMLPFGVVLAGLGLWRATLCWVKNNAPPGRGDYHYRHEVIFYGWRPGSARLHPIEDRTNDTVWEFDRPARSVEHPTMKPVALINKALTNSSAPGWLVLDPFAGSGSTLVSCLQLGRRSRSMELDPGYCDVICRRYQEFTGDPPVHAGTREPADFTVAR